MSVRLGCRLRLRVHYGARVPPEMLTSNLALSVDCPRTRKRNFEAKETREGTVATAFAMN